MREQLSIIETILLQCTGIDVEKTENTNAYAHYDYDYKFYKVGDIVLPNDDIFIEIIATATKGTIAKVAGIKVDTYSERYPDLDSYANDNRIVTYGCKLLYEVEGRKQQGRIGQQYAKILPGQQQTKYVRDVKKHEKEVVKNPVNKYKQEMKVGDWVIGVRPGKRLGIGRITRWTNHNVWAVAGEDLTGREFKFNSIYETFTMPDDEHVKLLTMAVLKGWAGN